jgi:hypothetical protein
MALNFPNSPSLNDTYTFGGKTWTWDGSIWRQKIASSYEKYTYTATAGQTEFSAVYNAGYVEVFLNGAKLGTADYTATNETSIVLATGATVGDLVEVIAWNLGVISGVDYVAKTGGTFTGDVTLEGKVLTTGQPSIYLDGNNPNGKTFPAGNPTLLTSTDYQQRFARGGMSWNGTNGRVTVPSTGHYFVSMSMYVNNLNTTRVTLLKNSGAIQLMHSNSVAGTIGITFVIDMSANDYLEAQVESDFAPTHIFYMGNGHTYFSAYLLG